MTNIMLDHFFFDKSDRKIILPVRQWVKYDYPSPFYIQVLDTLIVTNILYAKWQVH